VSTPLAYSMAGAVAASGLSRSTLERAIGAGRLRAKKSDVDADGNPCGVWVIKHDALEAFVDGLVDA
jgi:hypothetical protein